MNELHLDNYIWSAIIGSVGLIIKFIANMSYSLQEISAKMSQFHDIVKDHEQRIRTIEHTSKG